MTGSSIASALSVVLVVYFACIYRGLVGLRRNLLAAWSELDTLLCERRAEFPTLIETCRRHMDCERRALDKVLRAQDSVADAGSAGNIAALGAAEQQLRAAMMRLFAVADSYPALESDAAFQRLRGRLDALGASIVERRERYNREVSLHNLRVKVFPAVLVAASCGFRQAQPLEFAAAGK